MARRGRRFRKIGRRGSRITKQSFSRIGNKIFPFVKAVSAPIAFFEQITAKDRQIFASQLQTASTTDQLKMLSNFVTGRLAGFGLFHGTLSGTIPAQTINPSGVLNKWTNAGLIGIVYGVIGKAVNKMSNDMGAGSIVPETAKIGSIAKSVLIGGALGGFFDDAPDKPAIQQTQQMIRPLTTSFHNSQDSTESSF